MATKLDKFKEEMAGAKRLYSEELESFAKRFDALGKMSLKERPDIDTMDYIYSFEKHNGASQEEIEQIHDELYSHMQKFSRKNDIHDFYMHSVIYL